MAISTVRIPLMSPWPGTDRFLVMHRFGTVGAAPKVHLQSSIHAEEVPGLLVVQHLLEQLVQADRSRQIRGEISVVPFANPIGLSQRLFGQTHGHRDWSQANDFNRNFPDLYEKVKYRIGKGVKAHQLNSLGGVRSLLSEAVEQIQPANESEELKCKLLGFAVDRDIVMDLHCGGEGLLHLYAPAWSSEDAIALAAELGAEEVILDQGADGLTFDMACSRPWKSLAGKLRNQINVPIGCFAVTVELRGQDDISDDLAAGDARAIFRFLQRRKVILGDPGSLPEPRCHLVPQDRVKAVLAPVAGLLVFRKKLGESVAKNEMVAEIIKITESPLKPTRVPVFVPYSGNVMGRTKGRVVQPGEMICKVHMGD
jgi:hypothetical protein